MTTDAETIAALTARLEAIEARLAAVEKKAEELRRYKADDPDAYDTGGRFYDR